MKKIFLILGIFLLGSIFIIQFPLKSYQTKQLNATVLLNDSKQVIVQNEDNKIFTFHTDKIKAENGSKITIEYEGELEENNTISEDKIINYEIKEPVKEENKIPDEWEDFGLFHDYYYLAYQKLKTLTLDEKISQMLLVHYPNKNQVEELQNYQFGGFLFFAKDFQNLSKEEIINRTEKLNQVAKIPILTAVDEEGGQVVRVSTNPNLRNEPFKSSQELYKTGGLELIKEDTIEKSDFLSELGINLNLAPVVDVSTNPEDYMYTRSLGQDTKTTSEYAKCVIEASKNKTVSYTLKHFPGYGNNIDTHTNSATDNRSLQDLINYDIPPFEAAIKVGAQAILVSHNIVTSIDSKNAASLSKEIHAYLRNNLNFTGIIITDDLNMKALNSIEDPIIKAIEADNDLIITSNYKDDIQLIKNAIEKNILNEETINKHAFKILAWKYYKGLLTN